jgi:nitroreductase
MMLEAVNQGLGTCCAGAITPQDVHKRMNLPDNLFVHTILALGYPGEDPKPRPRKDMNKIVFWEKYA